MIGRSVSPRREPVSASPARGSAGVVTGAGSGIGRSVALLLSSSGSNLVLADVSERGLSETASMCAGPGAVICNHVDLREPQAAVAVMDSCLAEFGRLDWLVNCAGVMRTQPLLDITLDDWNHVLDTNLRSTFFCMQAAGRLMLQARGGAIVNFGSVSGRRARPYSAHYAASKAGIVSITKSAALALAPKVRVNAICPGIVDTPIWKNIDQERAAIIAREPGRVFKTVESDVPIGRSAQPIEIATVVAFLLSDQGAYITGHAINVDGGMEI
jgi:NAD(P)-dependent dehydrogenase (short-subunit alcohol dehydrogenase family)